MRLVLDLLIIGAVGWAVFGREQETEELGEGVSIAYLGDKGQGPIIYEHEFEEPLPQLEVNEDQNLELEGGGYEIYDSWIVG